MKIISTGRPENPAVTEEWEAAKVLPRKRYVPMPEDNGGADFDLVEYDKNGKPRCKLHGAMNKVSPSPPGFWRCVTTAGAKFNPCRAGCMEEGASR
jgi:hypothetical protein